MCSMHRPLRDVHFNYGDYEHGKRPFCRIFGLACLWDCSPYILRLWSRNPITNRRAAGS